MPIDRINIKNFKSIRDSGEIYHQTHQHIDWG